jgi:hypothetical protein
MKKKIVIKESDITRLVKKVIKENQDSDMVGKRIRMINMSDDPNPIPSGEEGEVVHIDSTGTLHVQWDNGRRLGVIPGEDEYEIIDDVMEENWMDNYRSMNTPDEDGEYQIIKSGSRSIPYYVIEKTDGTHQLDMMFDSVDDAMEYADRKGINIVGDVMNEEDDLLSEVGGYDDPYAMARHEGDYMDEIGEYFGGIIDCYSGLQDIYGNIMDDKLRRALNTFLTDLSDGIEEFNNYYQDADQSMRDKHKGWREN